MGCATRTQVYSLGQLSVALFCLNCFISAVASGGGYFVKVNSLWILKGIISAPLVKNEFICDVETLAVYTKVSDFAVWIKSIVGENL